MTSTLVEERAVRERVTLACIPALVEEHADVAGAEVEGALGDAASGSASRRTQTARRFLRSLLQGA